MISVSITVLLLSFDIIFTFFGVNIFGFKVYEHSQHHLSGFLKEELIAGGYIQDFVFLFYFFTQSYLQKKLNKMTIYFYISFCNFFHVNFIFWKSYATSYVFTYIISIFFIYKNSVSNSNLNFIKHNDIFSAIKSQEI